MDIKSIITTINDIIISATKAEFVIQIINISILNNSSDYFEVKGIFKQTVNLQDGTNCNIETLGKTLQSDKNTIIFASTLANIEEAGNSNILINFTGKIYQQQQQQNYTINNAIFNIEENT
ncbi:hypothetical protein ACFX5K_00085 [Rickettsiales bacterium LUAb2]